MKSHRLTYLALAVLATCSLVLQSVHGAKLPFWQHDADSIYTDSMNIDSLTIWDFDIDSSSMVRKKGSVLVIGAGRNIRGCNPFGLNRQRLRDYAGVVNEYAETFPDVQVYFLGVPTAVEFYLPEESKVKAGSQRAAIDEVFNSLRPDVVCADSYDALLAHVDEPIYSRTDHHWQPLGAYYAAEQLAKAAGVPFRDLSAYKRKVVRNYVGTMAKYSGDPAFKRAPEDFVYYVPTQATYRTIYVAYTLDKSRKRVVSETEPYQDNFFRTYNDGSGAAYCTFMGGDTKLTRVETDVYNGRRVLILKDSFGNALSSFLFYSFEQVHVVDCRYFTQNLIDYVDEHCITDIVFANNIAHTSGETVAMYRKYLVQAAKEDTEENEKEVDEFEFFDSLMEAQEN